MIHDLLISFNNYNYCMHVHVYSLIIMYYIHTLINFRCICVYMCCGLKDQIKISIIILLAIIIIIISTFMEIHIYECIRSIQISVECSKLYTFR